MSVDVARALFPNMPDGVFNIYIASLIERGEEWPFESLDQASSPWVRRWEQNFDHQSIKTISQLSWERHKIRFPFGLFSPRSQGIITALIQHHTGVEFYTAITKIADSRNKFFRARDYIARTGQMPVPVILQRDPPLGIRILDGNHRLAAMASFPNANECVVDCWVGGL